MTTENIKIELDKHGKAHVARLLIEEGYDNRSIIEATAIDRGALSRIRNGGKATPILKKKEKQQPKPPMMFQQNISIGAPTQQDAPVDNKKTMSGILTICALLLTVPMLIGVAYANIYYDLISKITPNNFSAVVSTVALEMSPFVIFASNNAISRLMVNKLSAVFSAILWVLCFVDVIGISYSLIQSGAGYGIGISYALILTVLHTGIITLTNEVLQKWTEQH